MAYDVDATNFKISQSEIYYDDGGGEVSVGYTMDDVEIEIIPTWHDIKTGQTGVNIADKKELGVEAHVRFSALETTKALLVQAIPMLTVYTGSGTSYGGGSNTFASLLAKAVKIRIHPIESGASLDDDWTFWKAANIGSFKLGFKADTEQVYAMDFTAFPDSSKASGMMVYLIGDPANTTLDITPPTLSSTVGVYADKAGPAYTAVVIGTELADVLATSRLKFVFSEALNLNSALNYKNYSVTRNDTDTQVDLSGETIAYDAATFTVTITALTLVAEKHYTIGVHGVKDAAGNQMIPDIRRILIAAA